MNLENIPVPFQGPADVTIYYTSVEDMKKPSPRINNSVCYLDVEVLQFACMMQEKLNKHRHDRGDGWKTCDVVHLMAGLEKELQEFRNAISYNAGNTSNVNRLGVMSEAADVANFAMFIGWKAFKELQDAWAEQQGGS